MRTMYYYLDGKKAVPTNDINVWSRSFNSDQARSIGKDAINGVYISTVFLGLDHSFRGEAPLIFETMIFGGKHDQYQNRYSTWEQAEAGHAIAVEMVKNTPWYSNTYYFIKSIFYRLKTWGKKVSFWKK